MLTVWMGLALSTAFAAAPNLDALRQGCFEQRDMAACKQATKELEGAGDAAGAVRAASFTCQSGHALGCFLTSMIPLRTKGYEVRHPDVMKGFHRACELGYRDGCHNAGVIPFEGLYGATRARDAATRAWLKKGCVLEHADSCQIYAFMVLRGWGGVTAVPNPLPLFERACALGNTYGCAQVETLTSQMPEPGPMAVSEPAKYFSGGLGATGLSCQLKDAALLPVPAIIGSLAVEKDALMACDPDGGDYRVGWSMERGAVSQPVVEGGGADQNRCLAAAIARATVSDFSGSCTATVHVPAG